MVQDAINSFVDIFSPPFRRVMWKSLALTLAVLLIVGYGLDRLALSFVTADAGWLAALISVIVGIGLVVGLALLAAPRPRWSQASFSTRLPSSSSARSIPRACLASRRRRSKRSCFRCASPCFRRSSR